MAGLDPGVFGQLLRDGTYSDFKITCHGHEFKVHRMILTHASSFFRAIFENECKEKIECAVNLPDDSPGVVARVIEYLYVGSYSIDVPSYFGVPLEEEERTAILAERRSDKIDVTNAKAPANMCSGPEVQPAANEEVEVSAHMHPEDKANGEQIKNALHRLGVHAAVHQLAEKLNIASLKSLSFRNFEADWDNTIIADPDFLPLLKFIYREIPFESGSLRVMVTKNCIQHNLDTLNFGLNRCMMDFEPMAWSLGQELQEDLDIVRLQDDKKAEMLQSISKERNKLVRQLNEASRSIDHLQTRLAKAQNQIGSLKTDRDPAGLKDARARYCPRCGSSELVVNKAKKNGGHRLSDAEVEMQCFGCSQSWSLLFKG